MAWHVMEQYADYERARRAFEWDLPAEFNPAVDLLRKHEDTTREALTYRDPDGSVERLRFVNLDDRSDRVAAGLAARGVEAGDRVGVAVPQKPANPVTHLANWKLGAVSVPLTVLFGPEALRYRLADSGATAVVVDPAVREQVAAVRGDCPDLELVVELGSPGSVAADAVAFDTLLADHEPGIDPHDSTPSTSTAIMYTSGSTGPPKGVHHSHALWLGRAAAAYNYFDQGLDDPDATVWTPADWAWGAALGGTLFAAWHYGARVVGWPRSDFEPEAVFAVLADHEVTHAFMPPTALRMLQRVNDPAERFDLSLAALASAGEPMTPEIVEWIDTAFPDVSLNEFYGQTELNLVVGNCSRWFDTRPGSMGKPLPGYEVAILDPETRDRLPRGEVGEIAVKPGDRRVFFDEYWGLPEKTADKRTDDGWFLTGDLATRDAAGYLWFESRRDDVILTRGYRVGPMEVETTLLDHPAVEQAGVVGVPHETYGEAIRAYVEVVDSDHRDDAALETELQDLVRTELAEYEYPDDIVFVDELPRTSTGKIRRKSLRDRATDS